MTTDEVAAEDPPEPEPPLAPDASPEAISFDDYLQRYATRDADGTWVVEGDILFDNQDEIRSYYVQRYLGVQRPECADGEVCPRSTVAQTSGGRDLIWNPHQKLSITYCIGDMGNQTNRNRVVAALNEATRAWEHTADINFIHLSDQDGSGCTAGANGVRFKVFRATSCSSLRQAGADFPGTDSQRLYYCDYGLGKGDAELLRTTKHELGHILGLHHEHLRWGQDEEKCMADSGISIRGVSFADADSIMGYDYCNGMNSGNDEISRLDHAGMWYLYNIPKGHGRLVGQLYSQYNNYRGRESDDVLWYSPTDHSFSLWSTSTDPGTISTPIAFTKTSAGATSASQWAHPLPVQWHNDGDANLDRELIMFGPGSLADEIIVNNSDGTFDTSGVTINGWSIPLLGNFHQGTYTEVLWWSPGNGSLLWRTNGSLGVTQTTATTHYSGWPLYSLDFHSKALVGNFELSGSGGAEILSFDTLGQGWVTRGTGTTGFETKHVNMDAAVGGDQYLYIPLLGDFNGDHYGDLFWYGPGSLPDRLNLIHGSLWDDLEEDATYINHTVSGHYKPIVGDFNGDSRSDIFWYQPGTGGDSIWLFNTLGGSLSVGATVNGDYAPIPGDFNHDGCDDVLWFDAATDVVRIWRSNCDGSFTDQSYQNVPADSYPVGYGIGY